MGTGGHCVEDSQAWWERERIITARGWVGNTGTPSLSYALEKWDWPCSSRGLTAKRGLEKHKVAVVIGGKLFSLGNLRILS